MATSLLAGYNWSDLAAEEITTAVKALAIATQERFVCSSCRVNGTFQTSGTPSDDSLKNIFPYKSNSSVKWKLNDGDPLPDLSGDVQDLLSQMLNNFIDFDKQDNLLGTNSTLLKTFASAADAPGTYDNRLFEKTGYTSWPDLSVYDKREVKKWYDMLTTLKWSWRAYGGGVSPTADTHVEFNGVFDTEQAKFYTVDQNGAEMYGIDNTNYEPVTNTTPYSNFKTDLAALFGTTTDSYNNYSGSGTYEPDQNYPYNLRIARQSTDGDYMCWNASFYPTYILDWDSIETATGLTARPIGHKMYVIISQLVNSFPSGHDTNFAYPSTTTAEDELYEATCTLNRVSNVDEVAIDLDFSPVDVPTNITDIAAGESITVKATIAGMGGQFVIFENWDGDGGFEYYTP